MVEGIRNTKSLNTRNDLEFDHNISKNIVNVPAMIYDMKNFFYNFGLRKY